MPSLSSSAHAIRPAVFAELQARIQARGDDLVPLHLGDTSLAPPASARFSGADDAELYRYGAPYGLRPLRVAIAEWLSERRAFPSVDPDNEIHVGVGGTHAIFCAARAILDPGDDVLLAAPYWPLAPGILASCGARAIEVSLTDRLYRDPGLDASELLRAHLTERTRAIYLITPNNPDGKILSARHLQQIAALANERDLWVFADEVYADHAFDAAHASIATLDGMRKRTITAYSLSKSHALAGARIGYVVAPQEVVGLVRRVSTHTVFNVPLIAQRAAVSALADRDWVDDARARYREARDASVSALLGLPIDFSVAEGGTYLFINFARLLGSRPLRELLEATIDRGVLLSPGEAFGRDYAQHARLCYSAVTPDRLALGLSRLREAIGSLAG